jgi:NADH:ubiquinone oxidoreductase subunit F (NADH-binding)
LKAVIPGGASTPMLVAEQIDTPMDFESLAAAGSMLGTGAIVVMEQGTCMVEVARRSIEFFAHESCGQCTMCRVGLQRLKEVLERITRGQGEAGDLERLETLCAGIAGNTLCPMGEAAVNPVLSTMQHFHDEFEHHIQYKQCKES